MAVLKEALWCNLDNLDQGGLCQWCFVWVKSDDSYPSSQWILCFCVIISHIQNLQKAALIFKSWWIMGITNHLWHLRTGVTHTRAEGWVTTVLQSTIWLVNKCWYPFPSLILAHRFSVWSFQNLTYYPSSFWIQSQLSKTGQSSHKCK